MKNQREQRMTFNLIILGLFLSVSITGVSGSCKVLSIDTGGGTCTSDPFSECSDPAVRGNIHVTGATVTMDSTSVDATDAANSIINCSEKTCTELAYVLLIQYSQKFCLTLEYPYGVGAGVPAGIAATISVSYQGGSQSSYDLTLASVNNNHYFISGTYIDCITFKVDSSATGPSTIPSSGSALNVYQCNGQAAATTPSPTTQPATTQPVTTQPVTTQPFATLPATTKPATTEFATTVAATAQPSVAATTQPSVAATTQPSVTATTQPSMTQQIVSSDDTPTTADDEGSCGTFKIGATLENCHPLISLCSDPNFNASAITVVNANLRIYDVTAVDITQLTQSIISCSMSDCEGVLYEVIQIYSRGACLSAVDSTGETISIDVEYTYESFTFNIQANSLFTIDEDGLHSVNCDNLQYEMRPNTTSDPLEYPFNCSLLNESRYDQLSGGMTTDAGTTEETLGCPTVTMDLVGGLEFGLRSCGATFYIESDSLNNSNARVSFESIDQNDVVGGAINVQQDGIDLSGNHLHVISLVIVIDIDVGNDTIERDGSVIIDFAVNLTGNADVTYCAFVANESTGVWSTAGMEQVFANSTLVRCRSSHLTSFAVLLSAKPPQGIHSIIQSYLSRVMGALSVLALTLAVFIYFATGTWKLLKIQIHMNLAISTALAQLLFMTMAEMTWNWIFCKAIAVTLQYLFTSALAWTMIEGVSLYRTTAVGFKPLRIGWLCLFAWGGSLVVVGASFGLLYDGYGSTSYCWLRHDDNTIYVFVGCVFAVLLFNSMILFFVMKSFMSLKANAKKDEIDKIKAMARALLILLPILGLTWFAGAITSITKSDDVIFFQYLFIVAFGLQGICILIFHCLQVPDIKSTLKNRINRRVQDTTWASKTGGGPRSTATSSF